MSEIEFVPCPEWAEKLVDLHAHRLSSSDQTALEAHLESCQSCAAVLLEYRKMDERIHQGLNINPLPTFTPDLLRKQREVSQPQETFMDEQLARQVLHEYKEAYQRFSRSSRRGLTSWTRELKWSLEIEEEQPIRGLRESPQTMYESYQIGWENNQGNRKILPPWTHHISKE